MVVTKGHEMVGNTALLEASVRHGSDAKRLNSHMWRVKKHSIVDYLFDNQANLVVKRLNDGGKRGAHGSSHEEVVELLERVGNESARMLHEGSKLVVVSSHGRGVALGSLHAGFTAARLVEGHKPGGEI